MNYAAIRDNDIANGEGVRVSLFVSGCLFGCIGCFNQAEQNYEYGKLFTDDIVGQVINMVRKPVISGLSILGGDPLWQGKNGLDKLKRLCDEVHAMEKTVWLWTGFTLEEVFDDDNPHETPRDILLARRELLLNCDVVVDGLFMINLADRKLLWKGSANQRVIDMQKTITQKQIILYNS